GLFLVNAASQNPERNFLGLELDYKEARFAARRLSIRNIRNVRILGGGGRIALTKIISSQTVSARAVYFPHPWWEHSPLPPRIFNKGFVEEVARILQPQGVLHSWTDVEDYFHVITRLMSSHSGFRELPAPLERSPQNDMDYHTNFERK